MGMTAGFAGPFAEPLEASASRDLGNEKTGFKSSWRTFFAVAV
jgi:hypothetical protein